MLKLKDISKWYANGSSKAHILRHLDLEIKEGEFVSIMGPSGSGKSTLLHILGMIDDPSEGEYFLMKSQYITYAKNNVQNYIKNT